MSLVGRAVIHYSTVTDWSGHLTLHLSTLRPNLPLKYIKAKIIYLFILSIIFIKLWVNVIRNCLGDGVNVKYNAVDKNIVSVNLYLFSENVCLLNVSLWSVSGKINVTKVKPIISNEIRSPNDSTIKQILMFYK